MPLVTICEQQPIASGFAATLTIDNQARYDITIQDPFNDQQERELEFYFEDWIRFPFDQQVKAQRAAQSIQTYGEELFGQIFADQDAYSSYQQTCRGGLNYLQIEIQGDSPEFQALHWEALKDPKQPRPLAVECLFTRKRFRQGGVKIDLQPSPVINLLVVTARPDEEADVGYRTISRPLIDAIQQAQLRVNVELLRPGTFEALSNYLENKAGFYHIIHFDAHGGLLTYDQFQSGVEKDRYIFQARYGRSDLPCYSGEKAFLFLEGEQKGKADPVEAQELADLLTNKGIPICILNACQSGKQVRGSQAGVEDEGALPSGDIDIRETSLGSRLMAAGVQMVVAMGYSVTVSAAALMMAKLYSQLFAQQGIPEAIRLGRKELFNRKNRRVYFNQIVDLEDWLLPVVYANQAVDLKLQELAGKERAEFLEQRTQRYRFEKPTYGFVGRDLEILKIEKALLRHNILLLRGMGGTGKTTLLNYLREWWQTTHFVKDVFYFGYDESAHTVQQILREIGKALYPDRYDFAEFEAMQLLAQMQDVAEKLRAQPYGLILDNLESVTGQELAIQNTLPELERQQLQQFLALLHGGKTKVVLGSRSGEEWLADVFVLDGQPNIYQLGGLDPESQTVLVEKILQAQVKDRQRIVTLRMDAEFKRLMKLLAGYPLAMEVVLANLARQSPKEILDALNATEVDIAVGGVDKTNNILKCVEYSYSNLALDSQELLIFLAPFRSFIFFETLPLYVEELKKFQEFHGYNFDEFTHTLQEAVNWGLIALQNIDVPDFYRIQPILPYFLNAKLSLCESNVCRAIETSFNKYYRHLSEKYWLLMESDKSYNRELGESLCCFECENLYIAIEISLGHYKDVCPAQFSCLIRYFDLTNQKQEKINFSQEIYSKLDSYPSSSRTEEFKNSLIAILDIIALGYFETQNYQQAKEIYLKCLDLIQKSTNIDEEFKRSLIASNYHQLGLIFDNLYEHNKSKRYFLQSLELFTRLNQRFEQGRAFHHLSIISQAKKNFTQAASYCDQAIEIFDELGKDLELARALQQVSSLYKIGGEYDLAREYCCQALNIYKKFNEHNDQANAYQQLGDIALSVSELQQARKHAQQALDIRIALKDRYSQAKSYQQLGQISEEFREHKQAEMHYQKALDIFQEFNDQYEEACSYYELGNLSLQMKEYRDAKSLLEQAFNIFKNLDDRSNLARTCHNLGVTTQALQRYEEAREYYLKALDKNIELGDRSLQAQGYYHLGVIAEELRDYERSSSLHQQAWKIFIKLGDQRSLVRVLDSFTRIYETTQDEGVLTTVAQCLNTSEAEVKVFLASQSSNE